MSHPLSHGSFTLQWHITHRCNLRCRHCYQDDYSAFSDRTALERVLCQYETMRDACGFRAHINITGGEPLLHPELFWLLEEAKRRNMTTAVLTNGTLIGWQEARQLRAAGVQYVQVSLDGTRKVHEAIRGKGSFGSALEGIAAQKEKKIFVSVSFTAQRGNRRELSKLAAVCQIYGADKLWFDRVVIPAAEDSEQLSLTKEDYRRLTKKAARLSRQGVVTCCRSLQFLPCREKNIYRCTAGQSLLALLADGSVMPCRRLPLVAGNVNENDLLTIYRDSPILQELRSSGIPEGCRACRYADWCGGGAKCIAYARTGRWNVKDPDCMI